MFSRPLRLFGDAMTPSPARLAGIDRGSISASHADDFSPTTYHEARVPARSPPKMRGFDDACYYGMPVLKSSGHLLLDTSFPSRRFLQDFITTITVTNDTFANYFILSFFGLPDSALAGLRGYIFAYQRFYRYLFLLAVREFLSVRAEMPRSRAFDASVAEIVNRPRFNSPCFRRSTTTRQPASMPCILTSLCHFDKQYLPPSHANTTH